MPQYTKILYQMMSQQEIQSFDLSEYQTINLNVTDLKMNFSYLGISRQCLFL